MPEKREARNFHVFSWPKKHEAGQKQDHGNFTRSEADRFKRDAQAEHPDREYEIEGCQHTEHKAA